LFKLHSIFMNKTLLNLFLSTEFQGAQTLSEFARSEHP